MSEANKATARRYLEGILSEGDFDAIGEVVAADYREHDPANEVDTEGVDGVRAEFTMFRSAFDFRFTVEDQLAEDDRVATRFTFRGPHIGEFSGVAATGHEIELTGLVIFRFADGMIQEAWWNWDTLGLLRQIGAIPAEQSA
jgi:steroid delta-isomerase-like uncharacterized protein